MDFNIKSMSFLGFIELGEKWNHCGLQTLDQISEILGEAASEDEEFSAFSLGITGLVDAIAPAFIGEESIDMDHLFTVVCDDGGTPTGVRDVGVFRHPDDESLIVLKLGSNLFKVDLVDGDLVCGSLRATPEFSKEGQEERQYFKCSASFYSDSSDTVYDLLCMIARADEGDTSDRAKILNGIGTAESGAKIKLSKEIKAGNFAAYLRLAPTGNGGGNWFDMRELECGEYGVIAIDENPAHPQYGRSFSITISDGRKVNCRGNISKLLEKNLKVYQGLLSKGKELTWAITSKERIDESRTSMKSSIWVRPPQANAALPASVGVAQFAPAPRQLAAAN